MSDYFLSHICYSVGVARPIEALREKEQLSEEVVTMFQDRGLRDYREEPRSVADMCVSSAVQTLEKAALTAADVDTVLIASSNSDAIVNDDDETALFVSLYDAGFERAHIVGLALQACSACGDTLRIAGRLAEPGSSPVLVVVFGQKKKTSRLGPQANLVFSDGAASCLVSADGGAFEVCASRSVTNTHLAGMGRGGNIAQFHGGMLELRALAEQVCEEAGVEPEDVRAFLGTNAGVGHLRLMAEAARVPVDRIYDQDVSCYSHVHSCDNLISLSNFAECNVVHEGDVFLLASWSPHVFSSSVLRYRGQRA